MTRTTRTPRPKMTDEERKAYSAERRAELEAVMSAAYSVLHTAPVWNAMIAVAAALPTRGPSNVVAIMAQCPGAVDVRGKSDWRKEGRHPAKGSTSLRIWAPMRGRRTDTETTPEEAGTSTSIEAPTEAPADPGTGRTKVAAYKAAPVYDISQTAGDPLAPLSAPAPDLVQVAARLAALLPDRPALSGDDLADAVPDLLLHHARARLQGPETVPGQRTAEAASAAQIAARMLALDARPVAAPQLGGIFTGAGKPVIEESARRVIETGRILAALATGTPVTTI